MENLWFGRKRVESGNGDDALEVSGHLRIPLGGGKNKIPPSAWKLLIAAGTLIVLAQFLIELFKSVKDVLVK